MARGQILTIPNQTAQLITTLSREQKASLSMLNPNDGVCYVKINGPASQAIAGWDWKVPSQSYCQLPGPWESLGVYYLDQSGSGRTAEVNVYELDSQIGVPSFIAIGRAVQQAGTTVDISQGSQPANPPVSTTRLWVDGNGDLHLLSPSGSDNLVYDQSNIGTVGLAGDLYGTISASHVGILQNSALYFYDSGGTRQTGIYLGGDNNLYVINAGSQPIRFHNKNNNSDWFVLDTSPAIQVYSNMIFQSGSLNILGSHLYLGGAHLSEWNAGQVRSWGDFGCNNLEIFSNYKIIFDVNGYSFYGVSGYPYLRTDASGFVVQGSVFFADAGISSATYRLYWDGTYLHSTMPLLSSQNVYSQGGEFFCGASNQSQIGIWNPGEFKIKSSPGNLYVTGLVQALGNPVYGNGAYVNTASSIEIKTNVLELDSAESLAIILDPRMRPVEFQYVNPSAKPKHNKADDAEPNPNAPDIIWPDEKLGFIAEEVSQVVPQAAGKIEGTDFGIHLSVEMLVPVLWSAVRELDARIKRLEPTTIAA